MIVSFKDNRTRALFDGYAVRGLPAQIQDRGRRKLRMLDAASTLQDLRAPPSNRLEPLRGKRQGQHSIRVNNQWRICFSWNQGKVMDVELVDYH